MAESGWDATFDPKLRPGGSPGTYASSIALALAAATGSSAPDIAATLASRLDNQPWIERASVTGDGYVTVTVTPQALAAVAARITAAGPGCVSSDVLCGITVAAPPPADLGRAATWEAARAALAAELTATLAAAAGATVTAAATGTTGATAAAPHTETKATETAATMTAVASRTAGATAAAPHTETAAPHTETAAPDTETAATGTGPVADALAFAGPDAVRFALARAIPGKPVRVEAVAVARNSLDNPAYAVRYAHARAVSGVRWVAALAKPGEAAMPCLPADPADLALLDALSWLPERVAVTARRGRPDEFARYLEELASATIAALPHLRPADGERLALTQATAQAARTALAAGLGLLGVTAPERL
ncbi:MAG TPA: DALR anticodon-binding domain-containing protein [Trebonia sp.]|nr:DALR anticodon-binding domain-containing protein [Trebonia sp.]